MCLWADAVEKGTVRFHIDTTQPPTRKDRITHKSGIIVAFCYFCIVVGYLFVIVSAHEYTTILPVKWVSSFLTAHQHIKGHSVP